MEKFNEKIQEILMEIGNNLQNERKVSIQLEKEASGRVFLTIAPTKLVSIK
ncbi:MAG: hypothetical protein ACRCZO_02355 [Cetobacterium sp.]|uniref:hypothetical protein n=1 Tax=Cetobacterium sp. TaxID=2071632 RepID=UPI003AA32FA6